MSVNLLVLLLIAAGCLAESAEKTAGDLGPTTIPQPAVTSTESGEFEELERDDDDDDEFEDNYDDEVSVIYPGTGVDPLTVLHEDTSHLQHSSEVKTPPQFVRTAGTEVAFQENQDFEVKLLCEATGSPVPRYWWEKDGDKFNISDYSNFVGTPGSGTITIKQPGEQDEGVYQCFAHNMLGTAVSQKTHLKRAVLMSFTKKEVQVHRPTIGSALRLKCEPPMSYPSGSIYWGISSPGQRLKPIDVDDRVTTDYSGNLYIANIKAEDQLTSPTSTYVCIVENTVINGLMQGDNQKIMVSAMGDTPSNQLAKYEWSSEDFPVVVSGGLLKMKCIFSGYPTPEVRWHRVLKPMPDNAVFPEESHNMELVIHNVEIGDAGKYECLATNGPGQQPVKRTIEVRVESMPFLIDGPHNVRSSEEENATFTCSAGGVPKPNLQWYIGGVPIENVPADPRRIVTETTLTFVHLTQSDATVIQCNASNQHGYDYRNAYLNVMAEPPSFIKVPAPITKAASTQDATLECEVFGAPDPVITWKRGKPLVPVPQTPKFVVNRLGHLTIKAVSLRDNGTYECYALNKFGDAKTSGSLVVRERTTLHVRPRSQTVNAGVDVVFRCNASTDPSEADHLTYTWLRDNVAINFLQEGNMEINTVDHSLKIKMVKASDTAVYTCLASNNLDEASHDATLTVKDRPDPVVDVLRPKCVASSAEITWSPGNDNNEPIIEYRVYYNTSFDGAEEYTRALTVPAAVSSAEIALSPWAIYTFHVRAVNALGESDPSMFTSECETPQKIPYSNPEGVCTEDRGKGKLVITWKTMDQIDHNGEGFHYVVRFRERDASGGEFEEHEVGDWRQGYYVATVNGIFKPYVINVQAKNTIGPSHVQLQNYVGHSGEGQPRVVPMNFEVDTNSVNDTSALFYWDPVSNRQEDVQGFFKGYRIVYWRESNPDEQRTTDIILHTIQQCYPSGFARFRRQADNSRVTGHAVNLWPYSRITAGVLVLNNAKSGKLSGTVTFTTEQGIPSEVREFKVTERGSHHFKVTWLPPLEPNGILLGYVLQYRKVGFGDQPTGPLQKMDIADISASHAKIHDLDPQSRYMLYLSARTIAGPNHPSTLEDNTIPASPPDKPGFGEIRAGEGHVLVTIEPTADDEDRKNPGSHFYVEYRKKPADDDDDWESTDQEGHHNYINVTGLEDGSEYEFRLVASNAGGDSTTSDPIVVLVGSVEPTEKPSTSSVASAGWFIALMVAILFLILILLIICLIRRNRGGKYPVHEKEKLRGRHPDDNEEGFGEYTRAPLMEYKPSEPDYKKSQGSINSDQKPLESDTDSMAEYDDPDHGKFNEDGSFIGQYGGKKRGETKLDDSTAPSALSTFV